MKIIIYMPSPNRAITIWSLPLARQVEMAIALIIIVHLILLVPWISRAARQTYRMRGQSKTERRLERWGVYYAEILRMQNTIPLSSNIRYVSKEYPWYPAYYLYPRLLRMGSKDVAEIELVHRNYPDDWALVHWKDQEGVHMKAIAPGRPNP